MKRRRPGSETGDAWAGAAGAGAGATDAEPALGAWAGCAKSWELCELALELELAAGRGRCCGGRQAAFPGVDAAVWGRGGGWGACDGAVGSRQGSRQAGRAIAAVAGRQRAGRDVVRRCAVMSRPDGGLLVTTARVHLDTASLTRAGHLALGSTSGNVTQWLHTLAAGRRRESPGPGARSSSTMAPGACK